MPRRFGVEIEFQGDLSAVIASLRAAGLETIDHTHSHDSGASVPSWTVKRDGSVEGGGELVSPPLLFDHPDHRDQVTTAVLALQNAGARPHASAGIHVHVEARNENGTNFTGRQLGSVVRFCYKFEDALYRIASSGWETIRPGARQYAQPLPRGLVERAAAAESEADILSLWEGGHDMRDGVRVFQPGVSRYLALNLHSYFFRGTIEFRYFNSSVNPDRVQAYIALCVAIVEDARRGHYRKIANSYPLGSMRAGTVSEKAVFLRLQQILRTESKKRGPNGNVQDTEILMSEEDWKLLRKVCWRCSVPQFSF